MLLNAHVPECSFLSCCKTLGSPSLVGYRFGTMPYRTVQRVRCPLFYIPSPSDVGIVFLLSLTALVLRLQDLLRYRRAFRSRDCVVIIYGSITATISCLHYGRSVLLLQLFFCVELGVRKCSLLLKLFREDQDYN